MITPKISTEAELKKIWCQSYQEQDCFYDFAEQGKHSDAMDKINRLASTEDLPESVNVLHERVNEVLWQEWDPIGVNIMEECRSEYDYYSWQITLVALYSGAKTIAAELYFIEKYLIAMPNDDVVSRSLDVAKKIVNIVVEMNLCLGSEKVD
ncbi:MULTISPECIES: hypothetical protein [Colwellia]|uniref:Uncharacterized protein n=1 Tax=Colwellia marinimaniae TaxID=1513592 RepID=A0ABQ0MZV6_9GAMM|nr:MULTISPECIES: hypothetical protein [Colwellia]GAW97890.1 hypothetical protein MTCD1_03539 [Colwellia marinimaniae]